MAGAKSLEHHIDRRSLLTFTTRSLSFWSTGSASSCSRRDSNSTRVHFVLTPQDLRELNESTEKRSVIVDFGELGILEWTWLSRVAANRGGQISALGESLWNWPKANVFVFNRGWKYKRKIGWAVLLSASALSSSLCTIESRANSLYAVPQAPDTNHQLYKLQKLSSTQ